MIHDCIVIGGGIAGLACASEMRRARPGASILVLESEDRLGGNIRTTREEGFTVEWGVNGFLDSVPETLTLVDRIGMRESLTPAGDAAGKRFIYRGGGLREVPITPPAFFASNLLSLRGRLRVLGEPFARRRPEGDETVFDFAARRIGSEAAEILVDAMVSGVYAGDSRKLSLVSTFPKMAEMEEEYGSLVRALIARSREAKRVGRAGGPSGPAGVLTSFRAGMESLIDRLAEDVGRESIRLRHAVRAVERAEGRFVVDVRSDRLEARRVIVAAPARGAAQFLRTLDADLAAELGGIEYAGLAVVALAFPADSLPGGAPNGFGFLAPRGQGLRILGCLWDSSIFSHRAPSGWVLLRAMIGGAQDLEAAQMSDTELLDTVRKDLATAMGIDAIPARRWIFRHPLGIPQYGVGHEARLRRIAARLQKLPGLDLAGNSYRGVAINNCVKEARELGDRWAAERA
jgi:protoporphyrinogen/coproporphyrinogen III oxidase